jgi:hypothetical protein
LKLSTPPSDFHLSSLTAIHSEIIHNAGRI